MCCSKYRPPMTYQVKQTLGMMFKAIFDPKLLVQVFAHIFLFFYPSGNQIRPDFLSRILCLGHLFVFLLPVLPMLGFPGTTSGIEPACQCRRRKRHGFDPWVRKIPWRREWPTPVFLPGEFSGQRSLVGCHPWDCKRVRHDWATNTHTYTHLTQR